MESTVLIPFCVCFREAPVALSMPLSYSGKEDGRADYEETGSAAHQPPRVYLGSVCFDVRMLFTQHGGAFSGFSREHPSLLLLSNGDKHLWQSRPQS